MTFCWALRFHYMEKVILASSAGMMSLLEQSLLLVPGRAVDAHVHVQSISIWNKKKLQMLSKSINASYTNILVERRENEYCELFIYHLTVNFCVEECDETDE